MCLQVQNDVCGCDFSVYIFGGFGFGIFVFDFSVFKGFHMSKFGASVEVWGLKVMVVESGGDGG